METPIITKPAKETPWGESQHAREIAPGCWMHSTSSHGGFELSPERAESLKTTLPGFISYAGEKWLEEDQDAHLAVLCWPEHFNSKDVFFAIGSLRSRKEKEAIEQFLASPQGLLCLAQHNEFLESVKDQWRVTGRSTRGKVWNICVSHQTTQEVKFVEEPKGEEKDFYTTEELWPNPDQEALAA